VRVPGRSRADAICGQSFGAAAHGNVEELQTRRTRIKNHRIADSSKKPEFIVRSDNGGKAAHKRAALKQA
jgi:hypothetical protein